LPTIYPIDKNIGNLFIMQNKIFIITGQQGSGKTTFLSELISHLKAEGISVGGFIAHGFWKDNIRDGFELEDLQTGEKIVLSQSEPVAKWKKFRRFYFNPEGFKFGEKILSQERSENMDLIAIDEIGPFELEGKGWRKAIDNLIQETNKPMIWVCRKNILSEIIAEFNLCSFHIYNISQEDAEVIAKEIISKSKHDTPL